MTTEPAWKKFLKLKADVPVAAANIAESTQVTPLKRKREALPAVKAPPPVKSEEEKKVRANKQKKRAKTRVKRSKKEEAESKAAQSSALQYLSLYCSARAEWKFSKPRQNYLLKHAYDDELITEEWCPKLLTYMQGLQGGSRERCLETAREMLALPAESEDVTDIQRDRAGQVLEALSQAVGTV